MKATAWQTLRERLNHDILQNQVLTELEALHRNWREIRPRRLRSWLQQSQEYRELIDTAVNALDPGALLDAPIFECWPPSLRLQMHQLLRDVYFVHHKLAERTEDLHIVLCKCVTLAQEFLSMAPEQRTLDMVAAIENDMLSLSRGISNLPRPVWIAGSETNMDGR
jgi:hypothetical protein